MANLTGQGIHQKGQRPTVSKPLRQHARGQTCTLRVDGCRGGTETVVFCHLRRFGIAGAAQKPSDLIGVYACHACHDRLDRRDGEPVSDTDILRALIETTLRREADGLIEVKT